MKQAFLISIFLLPFSIIAQECNCPEGFNWLKKTFENNDAGFQYIVDKKGEQAYFLHNKIYSEKILNTNNPKDCREAMRGWLSFFRKAHVELHYIGSEELQEDKHSNSHENIGHKEDLPDLNKPENELYARMLNSNSPFLEELDSNTIYLRIPSFTGGQKKLIDSIVLSNRKKILNTENFIIDIRNGEGGNDSSYEELMPFIYTNPIRMLTVEFLSTPLNNQRMYEFATNTGMAIEYNLNPSKEEMIKYQSYYDTLSNHIGEFVNLSETDVSITEFDTIYPYPKNVGIIINHNNVSTDEQFILEARQSKKVKVFGTMTKGGLDVSNLSITRSPCNNYLLVYALSKSLRIPHMAIDDIGIMPDYFIDKEIPDHKWVDYVNGILKE